MFRFGACELRLPLRLRPSVPLSAKIEAGTASRFDSQFLAAAYPALAGTFGAQSVLFAKSAAEVLKQGISELGRPATYIFVLGLGVCVFLQLQLLNTGLSKAGTCAAAPCRRLQSCVRAIVPSARAWPLHVSPAHGAADALLVVPIYQVFWVLLNVISGMIYFQDYHDMSWGALFMFYLG